MSSGLIDAVIYMHYGQVFAFAMTGNLVLLGVALSSRDSLQILRHFLPVAGFALGVFLGKLLLGRIRPQALRITLLLQMTLLAAAGAVASRIPSEVLVLALAITGAILITVIRRSGEIAFNITFMTGNLRSVFEGAFDALWSSPSSVHGVEQFRIVGLTCAGFLAGAGIGSLSLRSLGDHTFWIADGLFITGAILIRRVQASEED